MLGSVVNVTARLVAAASASFATAQPREATAGVCSRQKCRDAREDLEDRRVVPRDSRAPLRLAARRARRWRDPVAVATIAGLTAVAVHGLVDWFLVYTSAATPMALLTGIAWTWRDTDAVTPR